MSSNQIVIAQSEGQDELRCRECGVTFSKKGYVDHLFHNKECMKAYWREEERMHAFIVRHRSINRKRERELAKNADN